MELIEKYKQELIERKEQALELGNDQNSFVNGIIVQLEATIEDLQ